MREHGPPGCEFQVEREEMLVSMQIPPNRHQVVRVFSTPSRYGKFQLLRLQSRACVAADHRIVSELIQLNDATSLCGFVLDQVQGENVIDVTYSFVLEHVGFHHFLPALQRVAKLADDIEAMTSGGDSF